MELTGRPLVSGAARGRLRVAEQPLSFWGGYDAATGEIIDGRHDLAGLCAAGLVLAIPGSRGSSTTAAVLLEAVRQGTAPVALLTRGVDTFLALAAIVAGELYGTTLPVVALEPAAYDALPAAAAATIRPDGTVLVEDLPAEDGQRR